MIDVDGEDFERGCERVLTAVETFTSRLEREDDRTVMMVRFTSVGPSMQISQPRGMIGKVAARGRRTRSEHERGRPATQRREDSIPIDRWESEGGESNREHLIQATGKRRPCPTIKRRLS